MRTLPLAMLAFCLGATDTIAATLRTTTTLGAPVVRLSDLFADSGANADRVLGPAPGPGGRIVVEAAQLGAIARQFRVDWRPVSSGDRAVLERPGRPMRRQDALDAVRIALISAGASADCEIELVGFSPPLVPPEAEARPVVSALEYDSTAGRFGAMLSVTGTAMEPINMRIAGRVDDTVELPVATGRLAAGAVLRPEDVHMAKVRVTLVHGEVAHRPAEAVGMQTKRQLLAGQPFAASDLMRPAMVQRGATVMVLLDSPGIILTAQGQAMEAGASGERIRVLNPLSRAVIEAEVVGTDRVRIVPNSMPLTPAIRGSQVSVR